MKMNGDDLRAAADGYLVCAEWASLHTKENGETVELDSMNAKWEPNARAEAMGVVARFLCACGDLAVDWEPSQFGHSLFLSRNGLGAGFFDFPKINGMELQAIARKMGAHEAYLGDDGLLHLENCYNPFQKVPA